MTALRQSVATYSRGTVFKLSFVVLIYLDLVLTLFAVQHGFTEMNPFMAQLLGKPVELVLVKVLAPPLIAWLLPHQLLWPGILFMLAVAGSNIASLAIAL